MFQITSNLSFESKSFFATRQALSGKPASLFSSVPTQGGGAETALQTAVALLAHLGMVLWEGG